jgi:hypothetical protein
MKRCSVLWRTLICMLLLFDQVCTPWIDFLTKWEQRNIALVLVTWWHSTHTCAWCVTYQKRNETLFCLEALINMHAVAIRSILYGLNRFLDEMGVAQHRAHGTFSLPHWKFVTNGPSEAPKIGSIIWTDLRYNNWHPSVIQYPLMQVAMNH